MNFEDETKKKINSIPLEPNNNLNNSNNQKYFSNNTSIQNNILNTNNNNNEIDSKTTKKLENIPNVTNNNNNNNNEIKNLNTNNENNNFENSSPIKLELTIITSQSNSNGTKLLITKDGLKENSLRNIKDGIVYFGYVDDIENNNENENTAIDYLLPQKKYLNNSEINIDSYTGRYFQIAYNPLNNNYFLRDLGNGLGTFVKITDKLYLKDNILINIGDSYFVINFNPSVENTDTNIFSTIESKYQGIDKELIIKIFTKNENKEIIRNFSPSDKSIKIGRKNNRNDIDIELDDKLVSKINSVIKYEEMGWVIYDGYEINENGQIKKKESTNGTWVLAVEDTLIYDGMIFKANFNLFCCSIIKDEN